MSPSVSKAGESSPPTKHSELAFLGNLWKGRALLSLSTWDLSFFGRKFRGWEFCGCGVALVFLIFFFLTWEISSWACSRHASPIRESAGRSINLILWAQTSVDQDAGQRPCARGARSDTARRF